MNLSDFDALSFDCYGTLIDWETGIGSVLTAWAAERGLRHDGQTLLTAYAKHEARTERVEPTAIYPDVLARSFLSLGEELGVPASLDWAQRLGGSVPEWPAFPDSTAALSELGTHYRLIVLSNVDRAGLEASRQRLGVRFDHVLTAQDIGSYKPSPRNFEALLDLCGREGIAPGRLLHVAQSLFHDHVPAKAAGLPTVWINRRHDRPGWGATPAPDVGVTPDHEFPDLRSFAEACAADRESRSTR